MFVILKGFPRYVHTLGGVLAPSLHTESTNSLHELFSVKMIVSRAPIVSAHQDFKWCLTIPVFL